MMHLLLPMVGIKTRIRETENDQGLQLVVHFELKISPTVRALPSQRQGLG